MLRARPHPATARRRRAGSAQGVSRFVRASRYLRYFSVSPELPASTARQLAAIDGTSHLAVAAFDGRRPIGIARLVAVPGQDAVLGRRTELGIEVVDAWHGRGIGTRLARAIADEGSYAGYTTVIARVHADNAAVCGLLRSVFASVENRP